MNSCLNSLIVRQILPLPASQERITPFYSHSKLLKTHSSSFSIPNLQKSEIYVHMFCPQKWNLSSTSRPNTCFSLYFKLCVGASWTTGVNLSATGSQSLGPALLSCFLTDPHLKSPILRNFYTSREKSKKKWVSLGAESKLLMLIQFRTLSCHFMFIQLRTQPRISWSLGGPTICQRTSMQPLLFRRMVKVEIGKMSKDKLRKNNA